MKSTIPHAMARPDGRALRSARSRELLVTAFYELVGEGNPEPTAQQVSQRAGIGMRTVFRLFADMDALYATLQERIVAGVSPLLREVPSSDAPLEARVADLVVHRAELYERIAPYMRATMLLRFRSHYLAEHYRQAAEQLKARLLLRFPELRRAPRAVTDALEQATSFEAWDRMRRDQNLSRQRAKAAMECAVLALLREGERA